MAEKYFPFPSTGDRKYTADDWAQYFAPVITNGVFPAGTQLQVTADTGMDVSLSAGQANINGYRYRNTDALTLALDAADGVLNRKDRIVLRWDKTNRQITAKVIKGTPASSPVAPAVVRSTDYYDLSLAVITIPAGITSILTAHITDTRLDTDVCGIVSSLITPDTEGWYEAWEIEFQAWLASVQGTLEGDPATEFAAHAADAEIHRPINTATAELTVAGWSSKAQTVTVSGVTSTNTIIVTPDPTDYSAYVAAKIKATAQGTNSVSFSCENVPSVAITVNVLIVG